jgi:hypothetical protein
MANAAINIMGDGSIFDLTTVMGDVTAVSVVRLSTGVYEILGTSGLVPPPDGWGIVVNPQDKITADSLLEGGRLVVTTVNREEEPADILSRLTLHVQVPDAEQAPMLPAVPDPEIGESLTAQYESLRAHADMMIQPMQDLHDIGEGSAELDVRLLAWKRYRVLLGRALEKVPPNQAVQWPMIPD